MAQQIKPTILSLIPEIHRMDRENYLLKIILWPPGTCAHICLTMQSQRNSMKDNEAGSDQMDFVKTVILFLWKMGSKLGRG